MKPTHIHLLIIQQLITQYSHSLKGYQTIPQTIIYLQFIKSMTTCIKLMLVLQSFQSRSEVKLKKYMKLIYMVFHSSCNGFCHLKPVKTKDLKIYRNHFSSPGIRQQRGVKVRAETKKELVKSNHNIKRGAKLKHSRQIRVDMDQKYMLQFA